jgi:hypothetical protein
MHEWECATAPYRPTVETDPTFLKYLSSYLWLRVFVGAMGILLPVLLLLGDAIFLDTHRISMRPSLSAYYHSSMRDWYVCILFAIGIVLVTYKVAERGSTNKMTVLAGLAAMVVALAPTGLPAECEPSEGEPPAGCTALTGMQLRFGETHLADVHRWASIVFILLMLALTISFALQEDNRARERNEPVPNRWGYFHWACASIMFLALAFNAVSTIVGFWRLHTLIVVEAVCLVTGGASWLAKGLDVHYLRPARGSRAPGAREAHAELRAQQATEKTSAYAGGA